MEFRDVSRARRMVRDYDPTRAVPTAALADLLSAGLRAPSAGHTQGVSFLVLEDRLDVAAYWQAATTPGQADRWLRGMQTAPVLLLVWTSREAYLDRYAEPDKGWTERNESRWSAPYWFVDAGMASMAVLLAAVDHRLGACFFGVPPDRVAAVRAAFGVPEEQLSVGVISVGYAQPDADRTGARGPRASRARAQRPGRVHEGAWHSVR